jgi:hypothetical protein
MAGAEALDVCVTRAVASGMTPPRTSPTSAAAQDSD